MLFSTADLWPVIRVGCTPLKTRFSGFSQGGEASVPTIFKEGCSSPGVVNPAYRLHQSNEGGWLTMPNIRHRVDPSYYLVSSFFQLLHLGPLAEMVFSSMDNLHG